MWFCRFPFLHVSKRFQTLCIHSSCSGSKIQDPVDPRSKILEKTSWIQGLDPRSKIPRTSWIQGLYPRSNISKFQDSRKSFLDPKPGSKIQDSKILEKLLGSKVWIQDPRFQASRKNFLDPRSGSKIQDSRKTSWIQGLDPRSKIPSF